MILDNNGEAITGEMTDYLPSEVSPCGWPINDRKLLVRRGMDITPEQVQELRSQGIDVEYEASPEAGMLDALKQFVTKGIQDALKPFQNILSSKGSNDPMADNATQTQSERAEGDASGISDADWTKIGQMIDDKIKTAIDALNTADAADDAATSGTAEMSADTPAAEAPAAEAQAEKSASSDVAALTALVAQMAQQQAETQTALKSLLNTVPGGQSQRSVETAEANKGVWGSSPYAAAIAGAPRN